MHFVFGSITTALLGQCLPSQASLAQNTRQDIANGGQHEWQISGAKGTKRIQKQGKAANGKKDTSVFLTLQICERARDTVRKDACVFACVSVTERRLGAPLFFIFSFFLFEQCVFVLPQTSFLFPSPSLSSSTAKSEKDAAKRRKITPLSGRPCAFLLPRICLTLARLMSSVKPVVHS